MPTSRRKTTAVLNDFHAEINRLEIFDAENQKKFSTLGPKKGLSKRQLYLLTEYIFFVSFRTYEKFVRDLFLLYCLGKPHSSGKPVVSYLRPKNFLHAEDLVKSSMPFLDWTSPETVIDRAETYLVEGFPFKLPYETHLQSLKEFKHLRNHIAHNSAESLEAYKKVVKRYTGTLPLAIPEPGEYLLFPDKANPKKYKLLFFFDLMKTLSTQLV